MVSEQGVVYIQEQLIFGHWIPYQGDLDADTGTVLAYESMSKAKADRISTEKGNDFRVSKYVRIEETEGKG